MTRYIILLTTMCLALAVSLIIYISSKRESAQVDRHGSYQISDHSSAIIQDKDMPESAFTRNTDARESNMTVGDESTDITAALGGGSEAIEEFVTGNGSSFKFRELHELLSDENFHTFTTAMTVDGTPIAQQNMELTVSNTLFSHPLVVSGSVAPRSTNCGKRFCVISMTSNDRSALSEFGRAVRKTSSDKFSVYAFFSTASNSVYGREARMIFSTDPSLNTVSMKKRDIAE